VTEESRDLMGANPAVGVGALVVAVAALGIVNLGLGLPLSVAWIVDLLILASSLVLISIVTTNSPLGFLIDERNRYSLSRLQVALWTIVVLGAFVAIGLARLSSADPLALSVPAELWAVFGITVTSLAGTPLIHAVKGDPRRTPDAVEAARTLNQLGRAEPAPTRAAAETSLPAIANRTRGTLVVNVSPREASWLDLFRGEETGNAAIVDLGKVQMFYFTVLIAFVYSAAIANLLTTPAAEITGLPALGSSFTALLGISNGAYLANKAVPHGTAI
jgi:hypothetical protein